LGVVVPNTEENKKLCICPGCPTFTESRLSGLLFCSIGQAKETVKKAGCICPSCPVTKKYNLKDQYYCDLGKSAES
jgi:hypothetical protein